MTKRKEETQRGNDEQKKDRKKREREKRKSEVETNVKKKTMLVRFEHSLGFWQKQDQPMS
jgi:hypothetical protein